MAAPIRDRQWLRHAFLLPINEDNVGHGKHSQRHYATSAAFKFTNTSLGGNFAINNPPQFTRYADIRQPGKGRTEENRAEGMGRYYSEAIDDTKQVVHMSFGVPQYSSLLSFFTNFYDRNAALLANTGRVSDLWYNGGLVGGYIVTLPLQPFILGISGITNVLNFLTKSRPSKWYYFKPTMHSYWSAVNTIANDLAVNIGMIPRVFSSDQGNVGDAGDQINQERIDFMHRMFPDIFRPDGGIDVMALANRSQRMSDHAQLALKRMRENAENLQGIQTAVTEYANTQVTDPSPNADARQYFLDYIKVDQQQAGVGMTDTFSSFEETEGVYSFIRASQRDGSQFASFRVNYNGSVSESFSNSTRESEVAQTLNNKVAQGRTASFTTMGGSIVPGMGEVINAAQSFVAGALDSVHLGGLATLTGTAFMDIPKLWDGSTANLPRAEYTIPLPSPYGNRVSRYMNLHIPIAMMLAAALPLSAGRSAYTSPFLCQIYHQGRCQIQLGMIDSLTITRGTGNVGWNAEHDMLGAEISFSVVDMSSIMHVPIKSGFSSGNWIGTGLRGAAAVTGDAIAGDAGAATGLALTDGTVWDEQSTFSDYMSVLSSMSVDDNYYVGRRLHLNLTKTLQSFKTWKSPSNMMSWVLDGQPARTISGLSQYSTRFN